MASRSDNLVLTHPGFAPAFALVALGLIFALLAGATSPLTIRAELRSWIVAGRGRHLYLQIEAAPGYEELAGRVEFTSAALRHDYFPEKDTSGRPRLSRMTPGAILHSVFNGDPADRLERVIYLSPSEARCLQRDRVFVSPYVLLSTNSNAAMRGTIYSCGCTIPNRVARESGALGEFPGINVEPGEELPGDQWSLYGIGSGR